MSAEFASELEIAHVLCTDIVGYSKLPIEQQSDFLRQLNQIVRATEQFRAAETAGRLVRMPTGDGMVLAFFGNPEEPVWCALEIAKRLRAEGRLPLRMGIHSGPVDRIVDVNDARNLAGAGINIAQRVMDCGDAGHILLSQRIADDLAQYDRWRAHLHNLGECEVKHGVRLSLVNLYSDEAGNRDLPERLRSEEQARAVGVSARRRRRVLFIAAGVVVAAATGFFFWQHGSATKLEKSIAVLPFENLSPEKENAYFAGGIQDEVLTNLAKIGELKVISRTSVMSYATQRGNVREIGKALGVAAVVEGSVQRIGNRIRISVQLINSTNDDHIWAETYEKDLTDVFAVQKDVALQIASSLHAQLSPNERARLQRRPSQSGAAYLVYLEAQDALGRAQSLEELEEIAPRYEKAIELDPGFALAFARLSLLESLIYHGTATPSSLDRARTAANEALRLDPAMPEAHLAFGYLYYWGEANYERALVELALAQAGLPNDSDVLIATGSIKRRQGNWSQSTADYEKAARLNPKDVTIWTMNLGGNYVAVRNPTAAAKALDRGIAVDPNFFLAPLMRASLDLDFKGDMRAVEELLAKTPENIDPDGLATFARVELKVFERRYDEALEVLTRSARDTFEGRGGIYPKSFLRAQLYRWLQDEANARASFEEAQRVTEQLIEENPLLARWHALLGQIHAALDHKNDAIREGKRAVELLPEAKDAFDGPLMTLALAQIYTLLGDADSALPLLEHSLVSRRGITVPILKLDPVWDPLRSDARFQLLVSDGRAAK